MKEKKNRNRMKRVLTGGILVLVLAAMVLLSGCVDQDNAKSSTSPQATATPKPLATTTTNPQVAKTPVTNTGTLVPPESIIQQADVPELIFGSFLYMSARADTEYNYSIKDHVKSYKTKEKIRPSYKNVGQETAWRGNQDIRSLVVQVRVFDTSVGNGKDLPDHLSYCTTAACGSADIGDISYYHTDQSTSGYEMTTLSYVKGEYLVFMSYQDKTGTSLKETIRIAKAIEGRLKPQAAATNFPKIEIGSGIPQVSVIKPADVPELELGSFSYLLAMANQEFNYSTKDKVSPSYTNDDLGGTYKVVGQTSQWFDKDRLTTNVQVVVFETSVGNGKDLPDLLSNCKHVTCGSANIGSASLYYTDPWGSTSEHTTLFFAKGNYFVTIRIAGHKGATYNEAARLAGIVESRLK